jgi:hypothetical protein
VHKVESFTDPASGLRYGLRAKCALLGCGCPSFVLNDSAARL